MQIEGIITAIREGTEKKFTDCLVLWVFVAPFLLGSVLFWPSHCSCQSDQIKAKNLLSEIPFLALSSSTPVLKLEPQF